MAVKFPDVLEANNTDEYGIVRANQVMGHKTVPTLNDLYQIKHFILSDSGNNTNNDAIGQRWYVVDQKKYYKLEDWDKRNQKEGWKQDVSESADVYIIKKEEWLLDETDLYKGNFTGYVDETSPDYADIESFYTASEYSKAYNNARNLSLALQYAVDNGYKKIILETGKYALPSVYSVIVSGMKNVEIDLGGSTLYTIKEAYRTFSKVINDGNSKADIRSEIQNLINDQTAFTYGLYEGGTMFVVSNSSSSVIKNATFIGDRNYLDWRNKRASNLKVDVNVGDPGNTVGIQLFGDKLRVENITFREIRGEAVWTGINEDRRHINATLLDDGTYDYKGSISSKELTSAPNNSDGGHYIGNSQILNIGSVTESDLSKVDLVYPGMRNSYTVSNTFYKEINSSAARTGVEIIPVMLLDNSTISDLLDIEAYRNKLKGKGDATLTEKVDKGIFEIHSWGSVNDTYRYRREPRASGENLLILTYQHEDDGNDVTHKTHKLENYTRAIRTSFGQQFQLNPWEKYVRIITLNDFYVDDSGNIVKTTSAKSIFSIIIALNRDQQIYNCDFINCFRGGIGIGSHGVVVDNCKFIKDDSINKVDSVSEDIYFTDDQSTVAYTDTGSNAMITTEGFQACNLKVLNSYFNASNGVSMLIIQAHDIFISNCVFYNITFALYQTVDVNINNCKIYDNSTRIQMLAFNISGDPGYNKNSAEFYSLIRHINVNNNKIYCGNSIFKFIDRHNYFINVYANEFLVTRQLTNDRVSDTYNYWKNNSFHNNQVVMLTKYAINNADAKLEGSYIYIVFNADCYNNHFICNNGGRIQIISPRFKDNTITGRVSLCPRQLINSWAGNQIAEVIMSDTQVEDLRFNILFTKSDTLQSKTIIFDNCDINNLRLDTYGLDSIKGLDYNVYKLPTIIFKNCYIKNSIKFTWLKTSFNNTTSPLHLKFFNCIYGNLTNNCLITTGAVGNIEGTDQDTIEYDYSMPQLKLMDKYFSSTMNANTIIGAKSGPTFPSFPYEGMMFFKTDVNTYYVYGNNKWNQIDIDAIAKINPTLQAAVVSLGITNYNPNKPYPAGTMLWKDLHLYQVQTAMPANGAIDTYCLERNIVDVLNEFIKGESDTVEVVTVVVNTNKNNAASLFPTCNPILTVAFGGHATEYRLNNCKQPDGSYSVSFECPQGLTYGISLSSIDGYIAPEPITRKADKKMRTYTLRYSYAVDISVINLVDRDGTIYAVEDADPAMYSTAIGLTVPTGDGGVFMLPFYWWSEGEKIVNKDIGYKWSYNPDDGSTNFDVSSLPHITDEFRAKLDFDGRGNTDKIIAATEGTSWLVPAASYAAGCTIPMSDASNTVLKGYLASFGQLMAIVDNYNAIAEVMELCGYTPMKIKNGGYWSSSQGSAARAWNTSNGVPNLSPKGDAYLVRPLYDLPSFSL